MVAAQELEHDLLELSVAHLPVRHADAHLGHEPAQLLGRLVDRLDAVVQEERLPAAVVLAPDRLGDQLLVPLPHVRADRLAIGRRRRDHRDVAQPRERHVQRARDRRRRQREHVDLEPQRAQELLLGDAEALLLVDDHEPERLRHDVAREHAVRADQHVDLALGVVGEHALDLARAAHARHELDAQREVAEAVAERLQVLLGEHRRRREHQHLAPRARDLERAAQRDLGLAEADVAADQPVHRPIRLEVVLDRLDRARLVLGLRVRERGLEPRHPALVAEVRLAGVRLALRVQGEQLARELVHGDARTRLERLPGLAAELGERGRARVGTDVARDLAELVVRHEQLVLAAELQLDVVAGDAGDGLDVEAQELPDAVVLVHDVIARPQVGEARERASEAQGGRRTGAAAEDLGGGQQRETERRRDEPAACRARRRSTRRAPAAGSRRRRARAHRRAASPRIARSASPRCGKATSTRRPDETSPRSSFSDSESPRPASAGRWPSSRVGAEASGSSRPGARDQRRHLVAPRVRLARARRASGARRPPRGARARSPRPAPAPRRRARPARRARRAAARARSARAGGRPRRAPRPRDRRRARAARRPGR